MIQKREIEVYISPQVISPTSLPKEQPKSTKKERTREKFTTYQDLLDIKTYPFALLYRGKFARAMHFEEATYFFLKSNFSFVQHSTSIKELFIQLLKHKIVEKEIYCVKATFADNSEGIIYSVKVGDDEYSIRIGCHNEHPNGYIKFSKKSNNQKYCASWKWEEFKLENRNSEKEWHFPIIGDCFINTNITYGTKSEEDFKCYLMQLGLQKFWENFDSTNVTVVHDFEKKYHEEEQKLEARNEPYIQAYRILGSKQVQEIERNVKKKNLTKEQKIDIFLKTIMDKSKEIEKK